MEANGEILVRSASDIVAFCLLHKSNSYVSFIMQERSLYEVDPVSRTVWRLE